MALSDFHESMKGWVPATVTVPSAPHIPDSNNQTGGYLRAVLPLPLQYAPDTLRQYNKPGLSSFRIAPLPPGGSPAVNSASASVTSSSINEFVNIAAAGPNGAVQFNNSGALGGSNSFVWNNVANILSMGGSLTVTTISDSTALSILPFSSSQTLPLLDINVGSSAAPHGQLSVRGLGLPSSVLGGINVLSEFHISNGGIVPQVFINDSDTVGTLLALVSPGVDAFEWNSYHASGAIGSVLWMSDGGIQLKANNGSILGSITLSGTDGSISIAPVGGSNPIVILGAPVSLGSIGNDAPISFYGLTSGKAILGVASVAGTPNRINLPTTTGSANQVLKTDGGSPQQTTWATLAASNLSNGTTGSGSVVLATAPIVNGLTFPTASGSAVVGQLVASGTAVLGTGAIGGTSSATVVTVSATGVVSTDSIEWAFNAAPGTGYTSGLFVQVYVTSGNVNFVVTNPTAGSLTPAAATLNWRVIR